ncbi:2-C-methyl-D-erythritol 2,4-cyclodiphosphate synthase [Bordetella sputigena]|uniref:2-C-methyl-D-erythritol 2,4-cyclodiphosphate synthase n=1 Tax=Bordetella sputigena TaxID=1416810 RepID=UPI0039EEBA25
MSIPFRVGQGFDVHALVTGRPLIIGGVTIPHTHGLQGHSDADVLLHAITDAILGGAALGDIGRHFPDTDPAYRGADSRVLLRAAMAKVLAAGWVVVNIDATVHAQAPKIGPHAAAMVRNVAADLGVDESVVNIKAKTNEGLGYLGRKEGIAATVVALLARAGGLAGANGA